MIKNVPYLRIFRIKKHDFDAKESSNYTINYALSELGNDNSVILQIIHQLCENQYLHIL